MGVDSYFLHMIPKKYYLRNNLICCYEIQHRLRSIFRI